MAKEATEDVVKKWIVETMCLVYQTRKSFKQILVIHFSNNNTLRFTCGTGFSCSTQCELMSGNPKIKSRVEVYLIGCMSRFINQKC